MGPIARAAGLDTAALPKSAAKAADTHADLIEQFAAIKDPTERARFWAKHESKLLTGRN